MIEIIDKAGINDGFAKVLDVIDFDINNKSERIKATEEKNKDGGDRWVLGEYKNEIVWVNAEETSKECEKNLYNYSLFCPYCLAPMTICGGLKQRLHPRHRKGTGDPDCTFKTVTGFKNKINKNPTIPESEEHKRVKESAFRTLVGTTIKTIKSFKIETNESGQTKIEWEYEVKKIIKIEKEKRVLRKNKISRGYQPDLLLTFEDGTQAALEITTTNGKTTEGYSDVWKRWGKCVYELRTKGDFAYNENSEKQKFIRMYDPIQSKAEEERRDVHIANMKNKIKNLGKEVSKINLMPDGYEKKQLINDKGYEIYLCLLSTGAMEEVF